MMALSLSWTGLRLGDRRLQIIGVVATEVHVVIIVIIGHLIVDIIKLNYLP